MPAMGFLDSGSQTANAHLVAAFRQGLNETGYVEGQNVMIEYRWANGEYDRLPALAAELVRIPVSVLATGGGEPAARAAKSATTSIPIVFDSARNPVKLGWVASLNRPGGNMTGVNQMVEELASKNLGLLHELVPQAHVIAMLVDPNFPTTGAILRNAQTAMRALDCNLQVMMAGSDQDIDTAFTTLAQQGIGGSFPCSGSILLQPARSNHRTRSTHAIPTLYVRREFAGGGGLMSYGTSLPDTYRQVGIYTGQILRGTKPADLPVLQPTKFELVINLKTAKTLGLDLPVLQPTKFELVINLKTANALGLSIPPGVLAIADEAIE